MGDKRHLDARFPVASRAFAQVEVENGASGAGLIKTATLANINGVIEAIEAVIGAATDGSLTATVAITTATGGTVFSEASLADATTHRKAALSKGGTTDADFSPAPVDSTLTLTFTADKDPSTSGVTCDVTIFYR